MIQHKCLIDRVLQCCSRVLVASLSLLALVGCSPSRGNMEASANSSDESPLCSSRNADKSKSAKENEPERPPREVFTHAESEFPSGRDEASIQQSVESRLKVGMTEMEVAEILSKFKLRIRHGVPDPPDVDAPDRFVNYFYLAYDLGTRYPDLRNSRVVIHVWVWFESDGHLNRTECGVSIFR